MAKKKILSDEQRHENRRSAQENYRHRVRRFTFQFSLKDTEALEWFDAQPDKGQYLKGLILADKQRQIQEQQEKETASSSESEADERGDDKENTADDRPLSYYL